MTYAQFDCLKYNSLIIELCINKWPMFYCNYYIQMLEAI